MRFYGFHPFIRAYCNERRGIIYDLLEASIYEVPPQIVKLFSGKIYKSYDDLLKEASEYGIDEKELKNIIEEGKNSGIILELSKAYWKNEIKTPLETELSMGGKTSPVFFSRIILQPTGICNKNCSFCNNFINCCCFTRKREWSKEEMRALMDDFQRYRGMVNTIELYGGNPLLYSDFGELLRNVVK